MSFMPFLGEYDGSLFRVTPTVTREPCLQSPLYEDPVHSLPLSAENLFYSNQNGVCGFSACQHDGPDHLLKVSSVKVRPKQKKVAGFSILNNVVL